MIGKFEFKGEPSGECPSYFKIGINRIKTRRLEFHNQGYDDPAWHFSIHLNEIFSESESELDELWKLVNKKDEVGIIEWFKHYLPRVMKLIPSRRHGSFLNGFWKAVEDERIVF